MTQKERFDKYCKFRDDGAKSQDAAYRVEIRAFETARKYEQAYRKLRKLPPLKQQYNRSWGGLNG